MTPLTDHYHATQEALARYMEVRAGFLRELVVQRETRTLEEIARELGLSRQRVHQILKSAAADAPAHNSTSGGDPR